MKTRCPTPKEDIQPHRLTFSPPCFTAGTAYLVSYVSSGVRRIIAFLFDSSRLNLSPSAHSTWFWKFKGFSWYLVAYSTCLIRFAFPTDDFFRATRLLNPAPCNLRHTACSEIIIPNSDFILAFAEITSFCRSTFSFHWIALPSILSSFVYDLDW